MLLSNQNRSVNQFFRLPVSPVDYFQIIFSQNTNYVENLMTVAKKHRHIAMK